MQRFFANLEECESGLNRQQCAARREDRLVVPCLTLRDNTSRPVTIEMGTNMLVGSNKDRIVAQAHQVLAAKETSKNRPLLWGGSASARILDALDAEIATGLK